MRVSRSIKLAPMTVGTVWAACFLFIAVMVRMEEHPNAANPRGEAQRDLGATGTLTQFKLITNKQGRVERIARFSGPFEIWSGQWWRIPVNAFHHGDLLHLLLNGFALLYLGRIIEPRLGKWKSLLFYLFAATISILAETLVGNDAIGLSGVAYAQIGLLMVWRDRDPEVAEEFPFSLMVFAGLWLVGCQIATYAGVLSIANLAHYAGLVYGWLYGQALLASPRAALPRFLFSVGHLLLIPAFWFAMNPFWSGNWHWYLSDQAHVSPRRRFERIQAAVLHDRSLARAWNELAREFLYMRDQHAAFQVALEGLRHNPNDADLADLIVSLWADARLNSSPVDFERMVSVVFEEDADRWSRRFRSRVDPLVNRLSWSQRDLERLVGYVPLTDPPLPKQSSRQFPAPETDPDTPDSALGGTTM
jgi:rhomboid protease GluP